MNTIDVTQNAPRTIRARYKGSNTSFMPLLRLMVSEVGCARTHIHKCFPCLIHTTACT